MAIRPIGGKYEGYGNCVDIIDRVDGMPSTTFATGAEGQ